MKKLMIIDGNSIINRAFYGIKLLTNKHGLFTNAVYGFLKIMFKNLDEINPDLICVAFDLSAPTFRHKMYSSYKAQRKGMPPELKMQMPVIKEVLQAMNITILEKEGFEADDIIGTISRICDENDVKCYILSGDKDDLQLASDKTSVMLTVTKMGKTTTEEYDAKKVYETYNVTPNEFIDVKALMGDKSDNIPGVMGIGEKSAFMYIEKFKSIEALYENLDDEIIKPKAKEKLLADKDMAFLSKKLCTIDRFVDIDSNISDFKIKPYDEERLKELFVNLEFNAFLKDIIKDTPKNEEESILLENINPKDAICLLKDIKEKLTYKIFSDGKISSFAFLKDNKAYFAYFSDDNDFILALKEVFENESILKISDNIKKDMALLLKYGIELRNSYFDISIGAYVIDPSKNSYALNDVAQNLLGAFLESEKDFKNDFCIENEAFKNYVPCALLAIDKLKEYEENKIKEDNLSTLFYEIELPLTKVLCDMEFSGFKVDKDNLKDFTQKLGETIDSLEKEIYALSGEEFNINSPKQLGEILFEKLGLKAIKKTKTGYSTDAKVLEKLKGSHEIIDKILAYRQYAKLKSTYGDGLLAVICGDGKIHSTFNQTTTQTGRISSTEPNLQNIPQRSEEGREIRKLFVPQDDNYLLTDADYSQIELRILAHMSKDENLISAFNNGEDIHQETASKVFNVDKKDVTDVLRTRAKAVNFGIVYGMGEYSLSQDLKVSVKEAKAYIESYFEKYPLVKNYLDTTVENARENGYVLTLFGRKRYISEITSSNFNLRSFGERVAMNTPIQGTSADIIKIAMVNIHKELKERNLKSHLILQVHDELIIETHKDEVEIVEKLLCNCMENAAKLLVNLKVSVKSAKSWYDAH